MLGLLFYEWSEVGYVDLSNERKDVTFFAGACQLGVQNDNDRVKALNIDEVGVESDE